MNSLAVKLASFVVDEIKGFARALKLEVEPKVVLFSSYDTAQTRAKECVVIPDSERIVMEARRAVVHHVSVRVEFVKGVDSGGAGSLENVDELLFQTESVAEWLSGRVIQREGIFFYPREVEFYPPVDEELLEKNLVYKSGFVIEYTPSKPNAMTTR